MTYVTLYANENILPFETALSQTFDKLFANESDSYLRSLIASTYGTDSLKQKYGLNRDDESFKYLKSLMELSEDEKAIYPHLALLNALDLEMKKTAGVPLQTPGIRKFKPQITY